MNTARSPFPFLSAFLVAAAALACAPAVFAQEITPAPDVTLNPEKDADAETFPKVVEAPKEEAKPEPTTKIILGTEFQTATLKSIYDLIKIRYVFAGTMTEPVPKENFVNDWQVMQSIKQSVMDQRRNELIARQAAMQNAAQAGGTDNRAAAPGLNPLINRERRFGSSTPAGRGGGGLGKPNRTLGSRGRIGGLSTGVQTVPGRTTTPSRFANPAARAPAPNVPTIATRIPVAMLAGAQPSFHWLESAKIQRGGKNALIESNTGIRFAVRSPTALKQGDVVDLLIMRDLRGSSISLPKADNPREKEDIGVYNNVTITWDDYLGWLGKGFDFHGQIAGLPQTVLPAAPPPQAVPGL